MTGSCGVYRASPATGNSGDPLTPPRTVRRTAVEDEGTIELLGTAARTAFVMSSVADDASPVARQG
jgi:hypothetical protein